MEPQDHPSTQDGPFDDDPATLDLVRARVKSILTRSPAFNALSKERQLETARDTVKVARFIADAGGETAGLPLTAAIEGATGALPTARALAGTPIRPPRAPTGRQTDFDTAGDAYANVATAAAGDQFSDFINTTDFPGFVGGLIEGVFNAIVETSIQQMEAYTAMVGNVAKSVDEYMKDNVSEEAAMDQLAAGHPDLFEADLDAGAVVPRADADEGQMSSFLGNLGLPFDLDVADEEVVKQEVVPAMRKSMAMDRQKLLATMVLMGINRIVVTDGKIQASVVFKISASDQVRRANAIKSSFTHRTARRKKEGWWIFTRKREAERTRLNVETVQTDDSESKSALKATLKGNVDLRFKSETFPLEMMMDMLGTSETVLVQQARQPTPAQLNQVQPLAPPPPPALPPPPGT